MTLEEAAQRIGSRYHCHAKGYDLWVMHPGYNGAHDDEDGWSFHALTLLAEAVGCSDIDLSAVHDWEEGLTIERAGGACESCGHGDMAIVRGVLQPRSIYT